MGWIPQLFTRRRRYAELSETIREHLDEKIADLIDRGLTREGAEQTARREFGNVTLIKERSREVWQWPTLESILADVKFSFRKLRKSPGFALTAILTLALRRPAILLLIGSGLGIGAGLLTTRLLAHLVSFATPRDPFVLAGVLITMTLLGMIASWIPARRALKVDPARLLRE